MSKNIATLPEGTEAKLSVFLTSDETGLEVVVGVTWRGFIPNLDGLPERSLDLAKRLGAHVAPLERFADDWRLMTQAEVDNYQRRQVTDEDTGDADELDEEA